MLGYHEGSRQTTGMNTEAELLSSWKSHIGLHPAVSPNTVLASDHQVQVPNHCYLDHRWTRGGYRRAVRYRQSVKALASHTGINRQAQGRIDRRRVPIHALQHELAPPLTPKRVKNTVPVLETEKT